MKIHQMLPNYWYGDAIGNCATEAQRLLRKWGHESDVFAGVVHEKLAARHFSEYEKEKGDDMCVIYHYSTGSPVNEYALENVDNIILWYHNITPAEFFDGYDDNAAANCREGRRLLGEFAHKTRLAIADSPYNEEELKSLGFKNTVTVPVLMNLDNIKPSGENPFMDDKFNILFVGRVAPNKRHEDLIKVFHFYRNYINRESRLVLVGGYDEGGKYYRGLRAMVDLLDLPDVVFTGPVPDTTLADYFACASVFLCLSQHEGFCVPLLEAMRFRVPVVALSRAATPYTMQGAGALVDGAKPNEIAELLELVRRDGALRARMVESQIERLRYFSSDNISKMFRAAMGGVMNGGVI